MLLDSNIIIYSAQPENEFLRRLIAERAPAVSAVSYVEVLGYHRLTETERQYFEAFFAEAQALPLSQAVLDEAVRLRQASEEDQAGRLSGGGHCPSARSHLGHPERR